MGHCGRNVFKAVQIPSYVILIRSKCKMLKFFLLFGFVVCIPLVYSLGDVILGPGRWLVLNIVHCDDPDQYEFTFDIYRKKINRTHDCFTITMELHREINFTFGIKIDVFQEVDGGFKFYQTISDDCACTFLMKHAEDNVRRALTMAEVDPPECPLKPGLINIPNFVMDYRELPRHGVYGTYKANAYLMYAEAKLGCVTVILNFDERNDDEDDNDDDYE